MSNKSPASAAGWPLIEADLPPAPDPNYLHRLPQRRDGPHDAAREEAMTPEVSAALCRGGPCPMPVSCPRCGGCGYEDCADCKPTMEAKRPGCWRCGGTGYVQCEITPEIDPNDPHPHGVLIPKNGQICDGCDKPTPPGDGGCPDCWTPIPDNLADQKAMFAEMGLSLEKYEGPEAEK